MTLRALLTSEIDARRSEHVWHLLATGAARDAASSGPEIPRVLVQFWHNSSDVPADVSECLDSWLPLIERGFRRTIFHDDTARAFIATHLGAIYASAFDRCHHPAMRCDYFRLCWMLLRGGFYVDADEWYLDAECDELFVDCRLKVQPLCYDLKTQSMVPTSAFLSDAEPSVDRIYYVNNNPLIAPPGHPAIRLALERATRLLRAERPPTDIQSTTGPGNLTASLVRHSLDRDGRQPSDFAFIFDWDSVSTSRWPLSYRSDERNWRLWSPTD